MSQHQQTSLRGAGIILLSALLFGTYGVWSRLMGDTFPPFYQAWVRSLLIMAIMLPFMLKGKVFQPILRKDWPALAVFIGFCVCTQVPIYYAFNHAPIGTVQLLFYSLFVVTAYVVGRFYLGETITKIKLISMLFAFLGLVLVFGGAVFEFAPLGLGLAMLNGVVSGGEVASSKRIENKYSPSLIVFLGWAATFVLHLPISLAIGEKQVPVVIDKAWLWLLVYSIVNAAAFWLVIVGFRYVDASIGSLIGLMEVVFAVVFGAFLFHESLSMTVAIGGVCIIAAAMLPDVVSLASQKRKRKTISSIKQI